MYVYVKSRRHFTLLALEVSVKNGRRILGRSDCCIMYVSVRNIMSATLWLCDLHVAVFHFIASYG